MLRRHVSARNKVLLLLLVSLDSSALYPVESEPRGHSNVPVLGMLLLDVQE